MALAENVLRKIHKLGLIPKTIKHLPRISGVLVIFSIVWLLTLAQDGNYRNCYISENALMPGQVHSYFRESEWNIVRGYREEVSKLENSSIEERNAIVSQWLDDFGLQVSCYDSERVLYAIMHASRGENTEAMALVVPWINSDLEYNEGGIALALALMRYFNRISVWSKNIILVVPPDGKRSLRAWVEAYHTSLDDTAGSIEAAVVMEYGKQGDGFEYYDMFYEGLNGQLPNLDLLNTANIVGHNEGISCSIQGISGRVCNYTNKLKTLFKGILKLVTAGLIDVHGHEAFSGWQIQAFTIKARGTQGHDVTQFGRIVDQTFRSVNNLLEKFHQSFFFYLMLSPKHFVSIGTYLPAAVMLALSYAVSALDAVLNSNVVIKDIAQDLTKMIILVVSVQLCCVIASVIVLHHCSASLIQTLQLILSGVGAIIVNKKVKLSTSACYSLMAFALLSISFMIIALLIVHFALAYVIGILAVPLTFVPTIIKKKRALTILCLIVSNPFLLIFIGGRVSGNKDFLLNIVQAWVDLQSWTWFIIMLGWFPAWLIISYFSITLLIQGTNDMTMKEPASKSENAAMDGKAYETAEKEATEKEVTEKVEKEVTEKVE
ncbi:GAA1 [Candida oxycetoniae]|uniref:GAA1 n=1 Tax=Candida oxycetoniae TaxID=497107 RepID=A0AAI9SW08_9ASCO|nr:GAA1 [Candida oxycetoniae]KAI3404121.2 GAA1 [Candida oxycetoniae]